MTRLAIDPVTRIGGQLRVEVDVAEGLVQDAWCSATMFRGIELILEGRDARDAWLYAQRICGPCGSAHALASVGAVEQALGLTIPANARLIRNVLLGSLFAGNHIVHFYQRQALDWVDVPSALDADAAATATLARSLSDWPSSTPAYFDGVKEQFRRLGALGQLGLLAQSQSGHPACLLPAPANLLILAHYLEALEWQRSISRIQTLLGGKSPHPQTFLVGGMALAPEWTGPRRPLGEHPWGTGRKTPAALSREGLAEIRALIEHATSFIDGVFLPDALLIASHYPGWAAIGTGLGNFLSFGAFPEDDAVKPPLLLPGGRVMDGDASVAYEVDQSGVAETVAHAYYEAADGADDTLHQPWEERTVPRYAGPLPPIVTSEGSNKYSWLKAPRYFDDPMEVGPLARVLVAYASGVTDVRTVVDDVCARLGSTTRILSGTLGRTLARAIEAKVVVARLPAWLTALETNLAGNLALVDISKWEPGSWPPQAQGWAVVESPRGAVGHWVTLRGHRVERYQVVDATTWNASPRDNRGRRGALEQALIGAPVADRNRPVEILRIIHAFDPCLACGVH
jgi:[NiFe] hydrogenase large subunit/hydrogenase large subunit